MWETSCKARVPLWRISLGTHCQFFFSFAGEEWTTIFPNRISFDNTTLSGVSVILSYLTLHGMLCSWSCFVGPVFLLHSTQQCVHQVGVISDQRTTLQWAEWGGVVMFERSKLSLRAFNFVCAEYQWVFFSSSDNKVLVLQLRNTAAHAPFFCARACGACDMFIWRYVHSGVFLAVRCSFGFEVFWCALDLCGVQFRRFRCSFQPVFREFCRFSVILYPFWHVATTVRCQAKVQV